MPYNPEKHHRHSIRLKGYDYSQAGVYFVTVCTRNRELYFEQHPKLRQIVNQRWQEIPNRYSSIELDEFIIMPNHIHGIIIVEITLAVTQNKNNGIKPIHTINQKNRAGARPAPTIGEIKSLMFIIKHE